MNNLRALMNGVFGRAVPAEFSAENYDYEAALRDELAKLMTKDGKHFNRHVFNRNKEDVFELIEDAKIWIPEHESVNHYRSKKNQFRKRLAGENVPQHIYTMESILDKATQMMDALEKKSQNMRLFRRRYKN